MEKLLRVQHDDFVQYDVFRKALDVGVGMSNKVLNPKTDEF
jgi:hypothetical protein